MLDLRAPSLPSERGDRLTREAYKRDFQKRDAEIRNSDSWKFERRQHFEEQGNASRDALRRGDWQAALRLLEGRRDALRASALEDKRRGYSFYRVRVVDTPLTPYLQWELHSLRLRAEYGERIHIVSAEMVAVSETDGLLPEVTILGGRTLYRVLYTEAGVPEGAVRYTDSELVRNWVAYTRELYDVGEDLSSYFDREVGHLSPPTITPE